jgi:hypothetical protein
MVTSDREERNLIDRLYQRCKRLDDPANTSNIFVGIQTSADAIYHLTKKGQERYVCTPKGDDAPPPYEVEIEDALMKPLVSGGEAKRYQVPTTDTYLLFPYIVDEKGAHLIDPATMRVHFPKAWSYLNSYKDDLRLREARWDRDGNLIESPFDDVQSYRFGRHQNLEKQELVKLIVAQTVPRMRVCLDESARFYLNNVRVNGIIVAGKQEPWFLLGVLNSRVADFVFRRIAKVKDGGYFEANRQFIAPLPIPFADEDDLRAVAIRALELQTAHTGRREILIEIERRLSTARARNKPETWLFPSLRSKRDLATEAPARLDVDKKRAWAEQRYDLELTSFHDAISARLRPGAPLSTSFKNGELTFLIEGVPVDRIFVDATEGEFIAAQWKVLCSTFSITEGTDGKRLANALRKIASADNPALVAQVIEREKKLSVLEESIAVQERELGALISRLYGLTEAELRLIGAN